MRALACLAALAACGPAAPAIPDAHPPDAAPDARPPDAPPPSTVAELRQLRPGNGTHVALQGLVVVAHVSGKTTGSVWVQDAGGGKYSGIRVFCNYAGSAPPCALTRAQIDALAVGTVVDVVGSFQAYVGAGAPAGAIPELEIDASTITATGATMVPATIDADALDVAKGNYAAGGTADPYEGAYVHVIGPTSFSATSVTPSELAATCTDQSMPPQTGSTYLGFEATGSAHVLAVGLGFHDTLTYCLPCTGVPNPYPCTNAVTANQAFTTVRGIVEPGWNANGAVFLEVSPVLDSDLQ